MMALYFGVIQGVMVRVRARAAGDVVEVWVLYFFGRVFLGVNQVMVMNLVMVKGVATLVEVWVLYFFGALVFFYSSS